MIDVGGKGSSDGGDSSASECKTGPIERMFVQCTVTQLARARRRVEPIGDALWPHDSIMFPALHPLLAPGQETS